MKGFITAIFILVFLLLPKIALAQQITCPGGEIGIDTAIGCIPISDEGGGFIAFVLKWAIGIGGGIAFVLIVYSGFLITTSSGNPQQLTAGKELLTSAVSGLVLLVFSVFMLRTIGVDILEIPGFGSP